MESCSVAQGGGQKETLEFPPSFRYLCFGGLSELSVSSAALASTLTAVALPPLHPLWGKAPMNERWS